MVSQRFATVTLLFGVLFVGYLASAATLGLSMVAILGLPLLVVGLLALAQLSIKRFIPHTALFAVLFGLYTVPMAALYVVRYGSVGRSAPKRLVDFPFVPTPDDLDRTLLVLIVFLGAVLAASLTMSTATSRRPPTSSWSFPPIGVLVVLCVVGFVVFTFLLWRSGGVATYAATRIDRLTDRDLRRASTILSAMVSPSLMTLYLGCRRGAYPLEWWRWIGRSALVLYAVANLAGGDRRMLVTLLIALFWLRTVTVPELDERGERTRSISRSQAIAAVTVLVVLSLTGITRVHISRYAAGEYTTSEFLDRVSAELSSDNLIERQGELRATFNTVVASVAWPNEPDPSIIPNDAITLLPIGSDLPAGSTHFADLARSRYPSVVQPGQAYGINVAAEGYLAGGFAGVIAFGLALGFGLGLARTLEHSARSSLLPHLLSPLIAAMLINVIRGGFGLGLEATGYALVIGAIALSGTVAHRLARADSSELGLAPQPVERSTEWLPQPVGRDGLPAVQHR